MSNSMFCNEPGAAPITPVITPTESHTIILKMPILLFHPYNNQRDINRHYKKYKGMIPRPIETKYVHDCPFNDLRLMTIDNEIIKIRIYEHNADAILTDDFIRRLFNFIVNKSFSNSAKFYEKYVIMIAANELYLKTKSLYMNWFPAYFEHWLKQHNYTPAFNNVFAAIYHCLNVDPFVRTSLWPIPKIFKCRCDGQWFSHMQAPYGYSSDEYEDKVEATVSLTDFGKSIFAVSAGAFYSLRAGAMENMSQITNDLMLDLAHLISNFNINTIVWAFMKAVNRMFDIPNLFKVFIDCFKTCFDYIKNKVSSPQQSPEVVEATAEIVDTVIPEHISDSWFSDFFSKFSGTAPILCSVMATILVLVTSLCMGYNIANDTTMRTKSRLKRVVEAFHQVSKLGTSIKNLCKILIEWPKWVNQVVYECLYGNDMSQITEMLFAADVVDPPDMDRKTFFTELGFATNPTNLVCISKSQIRKDRVMWISNILFDMSQQTLKIPPQDLQPLSIRWISDNLAAIRRVLLSLCRCPIQAPFRFVPFWANFIGPSGVGKSTIAPKVLNLIKEMIKRDPEIVEPIPEEGNFWCYPMNFCSKYMTGYNGQHCVFIDDLFQDATIVGDATPSALLLIQMVSTVPFPTIQAAIDDKGIPFTSKIIFSTSNDYQIARNEVKDKNALIRRMNARIHVRKPRAGEPQELDQFLKDLNHPTNLIFDVMDYTGQNVKHSYQLRELCVYLATEYRRWWKLQQHLIGTDLSSEVNVDTLLDMMDSEEPLQESRGIGTYIPNPQAAPTTPTVDPALELANLEDRLSQPVYTLKTDPSGQPITNFLGHPQFTRNVESQKVESTASWWCTIGRPAIKETMMEVFRNDKKYEVRLEQFDCDCDKCMGQNSSFRSFRQASLNTDSAIFSIREFVNTIGVISDNVTQSLADQSASVWSRVLKFIKDVATHPLTIIVTSIAILLTIYNSASPKNLVGATGLAYSSGSVLKNIEPRVRIKHLGTKPFVEATNSFVDPTPLQVAIPNRQAYDIICGKIIGKQHLCILQATIENQVLSNSATRIYGKCILTNDHFFSKLKPGNKFTVIVPNATVGYAEIPQIFNPQKYLKIEDMDICVYQCDNHLDDASDITKHFVDYDVPLREVQAVMISIFDPNLKMVPLIITGVKAKPYTNPPTIYEEKYSTVNTFKTDVPVVKGQSGSILFSMDGNSTPRILGILVCRSAQNSVGYFKPISRTTLVTAMDKLCVDKPIESTIDEDVEMTSSAIVESFHKFDNKNLNYIGRIGIDCKISQTTKTNFVPSLIQDQATLKYEPSVLHAKDERMDKEFQGQPIIYRSIKGFEEKIGPIDTAQLEIATKELSLEYQNLPEPPLLKRQLLNDYDMVNGVRPYFKKVDMHTSPGYPFIKQKTQQEHGKIKWFNKIEPQREFDGVAFEMKPDLKAIVEEREDKARQGIKSPTIAYMCLKDELRPLAKIKSGSTRVFTCMPMDYNLLIRKYFGAFIIMLHSNAATKVSSCVGVNPAKDWYELRLRLCEKNGVWEDFDYKNWDQHLHPELIMQVANLVSAWYGDNHLSPSAIARRVLLRDLIHTTVMIKDYLFVKRTGQCSGCAITAELNCVVHEILLYYVYRLHKLSKGITPEIKMYRKEVACAIYGDDIIKSTVPESDFVGTNIKPYMDNLGMNITPGDKISTDFTLKIPEQIQFLKRSFTIDRSSSAKLEAFSSRAPLNKDIVANIPQWIRKNENAAAATLTNCNTALREFFMYGRDEFNKQQESLNARLKQQGVDGTVLVYENLLDEFIKGEFELVGID